MIQLVATDNDEAGTPNTQIQYSIVGNPIAAEYFRVVQDTGEIKVTIC